VGPSPKHEIGGDLVEEAAGSGLDFGCVLGDSNFGKSPDLRRRPRDEAIPYALEVVPSKFPVVDEEAPLQEESESGSSDPDGTRWKISEDEEIFSPEDLAQEVTDLEWKHIDWAEGTKETLSGDFYRTRVRVVTDTNGYNPVSDFDPPWGRICSRSYSRQYDRADREVGGRRNGMVADRENNQ
jgi:hypothetical protein